MDNEKQPDITPFCGQACLMQRKIHQVQLKLAEEVYKIKKMEARLKEISDNSSDFRKGLLEFAELVQSQLTWIGSNSIFPDHMP